MVTYIVDAHSRCRQPGSRGRHGNDLSSSVSKVRNRKTCYVNRAPKINILQELGDTYVPTSTFASAVF